LPMRILSVLAFVSAPLGAVAHHSPASFDQTAFVVIEGTVSEFKWGNPHVYLALETRGGCDVSDALGSPAGAGGFRCTMRSVRRSPLPGGGTNAYCQRTSMTGARAPYNYGMQRTPISRDMFRWRQQGAADAERHALLRLT
jgi:hypothetical protein